MRPGTLFVKLSSSKKKSAWKRLRDDDGVVHDGKPSHEVVRGQKTKASGLYRARCVKTLQLKKRVDDDTTCLGCLASRNGG